MPSYVQQTPHPTNLVYQYQAAACHQWRVGHRLPLFEMHRAPRRNDALYAFLLAQRQTGQRIVPLA